MWALEQDKGAPLTEAEVLEARDNAACIAMHRFAYEAVTEERGYRDIDPEFVWQEWLSVRKTLRSGQI